MTFKTFLPAQQLRPFVRHYLITESNDSRINRVLPETAPVLVFRIRGRVAYLWENTSEELPQSVLTGLKRSVRLVNYHPGSLNFIVVFQNAGAAAFFKTPLHELFELSVSLDDFLPTAEVDQLNEQLALGTGDAERVCAVDRFLLSKIKSPIDPLIQAALGKIHAAQGSQSITQLADSLNTSLDVFEKRFRKVVGASPKQFSSIVRLKNIVASTTTADSFTHIALNAGYFDQSHFNKEFKLFTGLTPGSFFRSSPAW